MTLVNWRLEFLISTIPLQELQKSSKLQDARKVLISTHFLTFETQPRFGMLHIAMGKPAQGNPVRKLTSCSVGTISPHER